MKNLHSIGMFPEGLMKKYVSNPTKPYVKEVIAPAVPALHPIRGGRYESSTFSKSNEFVEGARVFTFNVEWQDGGDEPGYLKSFTFERALPRYVPTLKCWKNEFMTDGEHTPILKNQVTGGPRPNLIAFDIGGLRADSSGDWAQIRKRRANSRTKAMKAFSMVEKAIQKGFSVVISLAYTNLHEDENVINDYAGSVGA